MNTPLLSVCLITYNHAKYIRKAVEGVLMQKVNFSWELIIADDFSTDGTREIVLKYKEKYPDLIKLILQKKNVGPAQNWIDLITAPSSKYMAYFEGDDYWTDPNKLQKQVDFLEVNPEYSVSFHSAEHVDMDTGAKMIHKYKCKNGFRSFTTKDAILNGGGFMTTNSMVFRTEFIRNLPEWFYKIPSGDFALSLILSSRGKVAYFDDIMSVHRKNTPGSWTKKMHEINRINLLRELHNATAKGLLSFNQYTNNRHITSIVRVILKYRISFTIICLRNFFTNIRISR